MSLPSLKLKPITESSQPMPWPDLIKQTGGLRHVPVASNGLLLTTPEAAAEMVEIREIHEMSRALGSLESSVEQMQKMWRDQEQHAIEGRRLLQGKMDLLRDEIKAITITTNNNEKTLLEIKPAVDEFKQQRQRAEGALALGRYLWGAWLTVAGFIGWAIAQYFSWPRPPLPPSH